ncbi:MAG: cysteine-rich CWC family protein [Candidatus Saccharibacteria bacterium]|nr:cysteine-rich CWC family protein [Candidatus Saccharibacteria bacterium]
MPNATPLANHECPLCGQPNQCTPAETGSFASTCWCKAEIFPPGLLALVDPEQRNKSCICQQCVNRFHVQHPH